MSARKTSLPAIGGLIAIALAFVVCELGCREGPGRSLVSRARSDMRQLSQAIEAYSVDNNCYPPWGTGNTGPGGTQTYNYYVVKGQRRSGDPADLPCFLMRGQTPGASFETLTTPQAYVTSYPNDPFSAVKGTTFVYWSVEQGKPDPSGRIVGKETPIGAPRWILISPGPDGDYDIPVDPDVYDLTTSQPSPRLLAGSNRWKSAFTYDPTNGAISNGDIWRIRQ